jgi:hypothetical protein
MRREKPDYLSYLLRLWRENDAEQPVPAGHCVWRATLQGSLANDRRSFASLDDLFDFLRAQTGGPADDNGNPDENSE